MGERRRVTPQKVRTPVVGLLRWRRWRLSVDLLQSLNSVVQGGHHLHLELEELLWSQRWRHRHRLVRTLVVLPLLARTGAGAPGVHHLFAAERDLIRDRYCMVLERKLWQDKVVSKECTVLPPNGLSHFYYLIQVCIKVDLHEQV
jgi:hypothetical protein